MLKTYSELIQLSTFEERLEYLRFHGRVGKDTFGFDRFLNQDFYLSREWKIFRNHIIVRDKGCDMGLPGYPLTDWIMVNGKRIRVKIIVHHINPLTKEQILDHSSILFNPENAITVSMATHNFIHYGDYTPKPFQDRSPNDTCPWKKGVGNG